MAFGEQAVEKRAHRYGRGLTLAQAPLSRNVALTAASMSAEFPSEGTIATVESGRAPLSCAKLTFCEVAQPVVSATATSEAAMRIRLVLVDQDFG